ncbi:uncharacterized protein EV420DRAFT_1560824 [Desarmillaria tabescens]|uniref:RING-type domain-containing protein n=1 Tax=Armillaria tabescens TaxID=1929756 RepID=A0AA39K384_ARMTA|nr:uncharacterized protein EV420DRAFT_1560824 [Desarmillaria tabescens]KAK0451408.1 hypothetical protein EV420DRAFT_1560824 [Desarmillaria tabescens]
MGQTTSRNRSPLPSPDTNASNNVDDPPSTPETQSDNAADSNQQSAASSISPTSRASRRSARSAVRKSILNLVKPRSSQQEEPSERPSSNTRKSWRASRRWSKTPPSVTPDIDSSPSASASGALAAVAEKSGEPDSQPSDAVTSPALDSAAAAGSSIAPDQDREDRHSTTSPLVFNNTPEDEVVISPDHFTSSQDVPDVPQDVSPPPTIGPADQSSSGQPSPSPPRQFPPPGTLVVVQGVVHTTDVPRTDAAPSSVPPDLPEAPMMIRQGASLSRSSTPVNPERPARNRLSALLRSRPPSMVSTASHNVAPRDTETNPHPVEVPTPTPEPAATDDAPAPAPPPEADPLEQRPSGAISSSSIDVLGTLLSVAAAATAASLLTGSSEPILSSGLTPPTPNVPNAPSPPPADLDASLRPNSPTPTAGMADVMTGRTERMRQAWANIRERLGLRAPASSPGPRWPDRSEEREETPQTLPDASPVDARERMFAEMARAFNTGLGMPSDSPQRTAEDSLPTESTERPAISFSLPAEGTFERFLIDLQTDLRSTLTQQARQVPEGDSATDSGPLPLDPLASEHESLPARTSDLESLPVSAGANAQAPRIRDDTGTGESENDNDSMPELQDVSDSDSEFSNDSDSDISRPPRHSPSITVPPSHRSQPPTHSDNWTMPALPSSAGSAAEASRPEGPSGRINWWRLYRFPPILAPRGASAVELNLRPQPSPLLASTPPVQVPMPETTSPRPVSSTATPDAAPSPSPSETRPNIVVPVIVVGLQSVHMNWRHNAQAPPTPAEPVDPADLDVFQQQTDTNENDVRMPEGGVEGLNMGAGGPPLPSDAARGRRWHARAANALRNLRPGRRTHVHGLASDVDATGSRTFLIYVIGGYYPPDHSIVTGEPNNFDSFEALLDLAELLGQVKPPTVSKEEIDKSGLEVIKSTRLAEYERGGKISSNCIDRCLICLDDYEPEDDVRVMTCRHAFHQKCVDTWLQTGKNNCPACRGTGVSTEAPAPQPDIMTQ